MALKTEEKFNILILDNDIHFAEHLSNLINGFGYCCKQTNCNNEANKIISEDSIKLLITNFKNKDERIEIINKLREKYNFNELKIGILSLLADNVTKDIIEKYQISFTIKKSLDLFKIVEVIDKVRVNN